MKSTFKIMNFRKLFFLPLIALALLVSCQTEETDITNPSPEDTIEANSAIADLMSRTTLNDGSFDNIVDFANCLEVVLPVTVTVNGITITIESVTDYEELEDILDAFLNDDDEINIEYPITVILSDFTEIVINDQAELEAEIENCNGENEEDDDIECIDFQYPIVFSIYNSDFQVIETVTIENDEALYDFIENIEGGVIASLNYPITMVLSDGSTVEVNNNEELEETIEDAEDDCDEDDDYDYDDDDDEFECTEESIHSALESCIWNIVSYNGDDNYIDLDLDFETTFNTFTASSQNGNVMHEGDWNVQTNAVGEIEILLGTTSNWGDIDGTWLVVECDEDRLKLVMGNNYMILEQDCSNNNNSPFECFENTSFTSCDYDGDGYTEFDLDQVYANCMSNDVSITYHETIQDAENNINTLLSPYTNVLPGVMTIYVRVELANNTNTFEIYTVELIVENCNTGCSETTVMSYLGSGCIWNVVNLNNSDNLISYDFNFSLDGTVLITGDGQTITGMWSVTQTGGAVSIAFDGLIGTNVEAITGNWFLVECEQDRLKFQMNDQILVLEQDCNTATTCNEAEVDAILQECEWTITSYAGETSFNIFNINFLGVNAVTIQSANEAYTGNWTSTQDGDYVYIEFSNISGGNVQIFNGINFKVVECTTEQMILHDINDSNNELVLDRVCI